MEKKPDLNYLISDFFNQERNRLNNFFESFNNTLKVFDVVLDDDLFDNIKDAFERSFGEMSNTVKSKIEEKEKINKIADVVKKEYKELENENISKECAFCKNKTKDTKLFSDPKGIFREAVRRAVSNDNEITKYINDQDLLAKKTAMFIRSSNAINPELKDSSILFFKMVQFVRAIFGEFTAEEYKDLLLKYVQKFRECNVLNESVKCFREEIFGKDEKFLPFNNGVRFSLKIDSSSTSGRILRERRINIGDGNFVLTVLLDDVLTKNDGNPIVTISYSSKNKEIASMDVSSRTKLGDMIRFAENID